MKKSYAYIRDRWKLNIWEYDGTWISEYYNTHIRFYFLFFEHFRFARFILKITNNKAETIFSRLTVGGWYGLWLVKSAARTTLNYIAHWFFITVNTKWQFTKLHLHIYKTHASLAHTDWMAHICTYALPKYPIKSNWLNFVYKYMYFILQP